MQFIDNGPNIPDALLQAHEEGNVVFFCGAGISMSAGLPNFKGLVDKIYQRLNTTQADVEKQAYERGQFEIVLNLLEQRIPGQRSALRVALNESLSITPECLGDTDNHTSLLQLARNRSNALRLVTTNFDRIFEYCRDSSNMSFESYAAPTLPIPKNSKWNSLVYLHGLLPTDSNKFALDNLVVTSADFGLAYLTERWAARFISELLSNFIVCFIGYSINDLVLRYVIDALAADRTRGEATPESYAFVGCKHGEETNKRNEWRNKQVTPILYSIDSNNDHSALSQTLKCWAQTYRDGIIGKEKIVTQYAQSQPTVSTHEDNFVERMLWAISDTSGQPAKNFSEINPAPPIEWLTAFSEYKLTTCLTSAGNNSHAEWDMVTNNLAKWMLRHLNNPELICWLADQNNHLHVRFASMIQLKLDDLVELKINGNTDELNKILNHSPNTIPCKVMTVLWQLFLRGRVKNIQSDGSLYAWKQRLNLYGLTLSLRLELRELLSPAIELTRPYPWIEENFSSSSSIDSSNVPEINLALSASYANSEIDRWNDDSSDEIWHQALPELVDDFQYLLRDALDLQRELGKANEHSDLSHLSMPSISKHWQNRDHDDWTLLIVLLREAWLVVLRDDSDRARIIAENWFDLPYPLFKRMAFFAASHDNCIDASLWVKWLLSDDAWWLWYKGTQREVSRLLAQQGKFLSSFQNELETAILIGPFRDMFGEKLGDNDWKRMADRWIWLRLVKLKTSGLRLGDAAYSRLDKLSATYSNLNSSPHEREEFPYWISGSGDPDYEDNIPVNLALKKRGELVEWLRETPDQTDSWTEDTWPETCQSHFCHCLFALRELSNEEIWPTTRWRQALHVWSKEGQIKRSWNYTAPLVNEMPDDQLMDILHSAAWWLESASKSIEKHESVLLNLCQRVLNLNSKLNSEVIQEVAPIECPFTSAINHPVGLVTQALLNVWLKERPNDNDILPQKFKCFFTRVCDTSEPEFRHGRAVLASRLITLFRVDESWTEQNLLPLFQWRNNHIEAQSAWQSFLWSGRLHQPLLVKLKPHFLETGNYYDELGNCRRQYAELLTYCALDNIDGFISTDFVSAFSALPVIGLQESAWTLSNSLESTGEQSEDYWENRVKPFWKQVWPKSNELISDGIAEALVLTSIAARGQFPEACELFIHFFQPIRNAGYVTKRLEESGLCRRFPKQALKLLGIIINDESWLSKNRLMSCLSAILQVQPDLQCEQNYKNLIKFAG